MPLGIAFWTIMIIWFVFGMIVHFGVVAGAAVWGVAVSNLLLFVLFGMLGWQVFGPAVHR
jgi:ABC-type polysaccharide/polyol phosphate export permease